MKENRIIYEEGDLAVVEVVGSPLTEPTVPRTQIKTGLIGELFTHE